MTAETTSTTRIFVGGLGESVSSDDLLKISSSFGTANAVDIVRTKGRRFAYLDFLPSSHNSLSKLFSTYNGCVWKGGRLRLEKAKEHYRVRLEREWAEDAELASSACSNGVDADVKTNSSEKPKEVLTPGKEQLRIFFPRLGKVKSLALSGTGKHKYSFKRVEVPPLPMYFCDCEEHSGPAYTAEEKKNTFDLEAESCGMNEEELNIMHSVMSKLFDRENVSNAPRTGIGLAKEGDNPIKLIDVLQSDENEVDDTADGDDLIINVVTSVDEGKALLGSWGQETFSASQKTNIVPPKKKRKLHLYEESNRNEFESAMPGSKENLQTCSNGPGTLLGSQPAEPESGLKQSTTGFSWSQKSSWREIVGAGGNNSFSVSNILPNIASAKEEQPRSDSLDVPNSSDSKNQNLGNIESMEDQMGKTEVADELAQAQPSKTNAILDDSGRSSSWFQKFSWKQLVGENNNGSFSITHIVPGMTLEKQELTEPSFANIANSTENKHSNLVKQHKREPTGDGFTAMGVGKERDVAWSTLEKNQQIIMGSNEGSVPMVEKKQDSSPKKTSSGGMIIGETCSFMRSAASLKEWASTKSTLSGTRKRKSTEK